MMDDIDRDACADVHLATEAALTAEGWQIEKVVFDDPGMRVVATRTGDWGLGPAFARRGTVTVTIEWGDRT